MTKAQGGNDARDLAKQAESLMESLYDASMAAAIKGDAMRSERLNEAADHALARYERRFNALRCN